MTGGTYIINMKSLINPCCYHIERTSIVLQVFKSHASGVLMIGFVIVEHIIALRNLKSIFVAAVAGVGTHNGHQKEKYNSDGHKCPKPWVVAIVGEKLFHCFFLMVCVLKMSVFKWREAMSVLRLKRQRTILVYI